VLGFLSGVFCCPLAFVCTPAGMRDAQHPDVFLVVVGFELSFELAHFKTAELVRVFKLVKYLQRLNG